MLFVLSFLIICLLALTFYNVNITRTVWRSVIHDKNQKILQTLFVWLIPIAGAIIATQVHKSSGSNPSKSWADGSEWDGGASAGFQFNGCSSDFGGDCD